MGMLCEVVSLNFFLAIVGLKLEPVNKRIVKQVDLLFSFPLIALLLSFCSPGDLRGGRVHGRFL